MCHNKIMYRLYYTVLQAVKYNTIFSYYRVGHNCAIYSLHAHYTQFTNAILIGKYMFLVVDNTFIHQDHHLNFQTNFYLKLNCFLS